MNEDETKTPEGAEDFVAPRTGDEEENKKKSKSEIKDNKRNDKENPTREEIERRKKEARGDYCNK